MVVARPARIFHPDGIAQRVTVTIRPTSEDAGAREVGVAPLDRPGTYEGVVRFSRGLSIRRVTTSTICLDSGRCATPRAKSVSGGHRAKSG